MNDYDIIILDWMLPDGNGIDFLKELRQAQFLAPVIMLTAKTELIDKILGLESGANDYITKPFEPRELLARIRVQLRNISTNIQKKINIEKILFEDIEMNNTKREVFFKKTKIDLTKMEYELLKLLIKHPEKSFSREEILNKVWGFENYPTTRTVDTHVLQLRQKLCEELIETVWGFGYRIKSIRT